MAQAQDSRGFEDWAKGPSTILTQAEEAMFIAFRRHTLLPLDDCLYASHPCEQGLQGYSIFRNYPISTNIEK